MANELQKEWLNFSEHAGIITATQSAAIEQLIDGWRTVSNIATVNEKASAPEVAIRDSNFKFSAASLAELKGVKKELVDCVKLALKLSTQDFTVFDGIRTLKEQQQHVANGTSKTMQSKHLQGLAVDLVPWIGGKLVWDWEGCYKIAMAMDAAATQLGIADKIRWGGAWDRTLADFGSLDSWKAYESEVRAYHVRTGKSFVDGPHFEWVG